MGIQVNDKISKLITKKYGEFSKENMKRYFLEEFFVGSISRKIDEQDYEAILAQMELLASAQGLSLEDVDYLGFGQRFSCIGVGDAVIKVGNTTEKVYDNPYRISPVFKQDLKKYPPTSHELDLGLYVSQRARTTGIPESKAKEMYSMIRDAGGLWLDIKEENLGVIDKKMDFQGIYSNQSNVNEVSNQEFAEYDGNLFIIDYEDVLFLTPELRDKMISGTADNINYVPRELLVPGNTNDQIYFEAFIKNSNKLLKYEMDYQKERGNLSAASKCFSELLKNEREIRQYRYAENQRYLHDRNPSDIQNQFSIREIAIQIAQKTNMKALDRITEWVRSKIQQVRDRREVDSSYIAESVIEEIKPVTLTLEEISVGEFEQGKSKDTNESLSRKPREMNPNDLEDPYTTR